MIVVVVGAGLAGLAAGRALQAAGHQVTVLERSRLVGGKATSFVAGVRRGVEEEVDNGQHVFLGCFDAWLGLVADAGMAHALHLPPRFEVALLAPDGARARLRAARLPSPLHLGPALLGNRLLGARGRFRVARAMIAARQSARPGETLAGWLRRGDRAHASGPRSGTRSWCRRSTRPSKRSTPRPGSSFSAPLFWGSRAPRVSAGRGFRWAGSRRRSRPVSTYASGSRSESW